MSSCQTCETHKQVKPRSISFSIFFAPVVLTWVIHWDFRWKIEERLTRFVPPWLKCFSFQSTRFSCHEYFTKTRMRSWNVYVYDFRNLHQSIFNTLVIKALILGVFYNFGVGHPHSSRLWVFDLLKCWTWVYPDVTVSTLYVGMNGRSVFCNLSVKHSLNPPSIQHSFQCIQAFTNISSYFPLKYLVNQAFYVL